ncbi:amino acid permease 4-like [Vigna unguiculata]|uniref:amino acid permease 4-like n=1 Tax=Vigna unguiculata TaxID=3917 RepID=UPI0010167827|nr:amino acid permease 4-like [Vigna unguiculata]XP_027904182.1 amino acid permease 4-like [Vigna unguiculata]XP_027904183.1 amino acid permease 4-like [Vigna unguiculata]XP_027904184.1 amino acid permease 4-like [Vigna unguiculata]XP_027904185.1 amino acid permease 4-like [Vigna unguiculata]
MSSKMVENDSVTNVSYRRGRGYDIEEDSIDGATLKNDPEYYDDDGRLKRTGNVWTTSSHIITAVVGSGVLSLAWAIAQMGWIAGPSVMILFSIVTLYTSSFLADCYRTGDPMFGTRNYTFMDAVSTILGGRSVTLCGIVQYLNLFGSAVGYTIAASLSMMALKRSHCLHFSDEENSCHISSNPYMIGFGAMQIIFSQIPDFHNMWWLSIVAAIMSFTYSIIGLLLGIVKITETGTIKGSLTGIGIEAVTEAQKVWGVFQALGNIAFAYSYSFVLLEIQDTIKAVPSEVKTMKKATKLSIAVTTTFYMLCGCTGYAAFGDLAPGNLLAGFGYHKLFWLIDMANAAIVIHLVGAYQVYAQPLFAFVEKETAKRWPKIDKEFKISVPGLRPYKQNIFSLVWRTVFVIITTVISMLLPFFNDVLGVIGALGFWPLTVYFPVEMYILQKRIPKWSMTWISLQLMSVVCLIVSILAGLGSVVGVLLDLKRYKPFSSDY